MRPIDADAIRERHISVARFFKALENGKKFTKLIGVLVKRIDEAPTLDYAPVRHGEWVHCKGKSNLWYCSECGGKILYNPTRRTYNITKLSVEQVNKFCRNCGAKMDGGKENDAP